MITLISSLMVTNTDDEYPLIISGTKVKDRKGFNEYIPTLFKIEANDSKELLRQMVTQCVEVIAAHAEHNAQYSGQNLVSRAELLESLDTALDMGVI